MFGPLTGVSAFHITVDGRDFSTNKAFTNIESLVVEQNINLPDALTVVFRDVGLAASGDDPLSFGATDADPMPIGCEVSISLGRDEKPKPVFTGEVTAQELDVRHSAPAKYVIRAYDHSHRLQRGRLHRTFLNQKDSDIASKIASEEHLTPEIEESQQVHDYILQNNQTNFDFLQTRAKRIGFECFVADKKLYFRKPKVDAAAVLMVNVKQDVSRLHLRMTSSGQVTKVTTMGWDPDQQAPLIGEATQGIATATGGSQKIGTQLAQTFGETTLHSGARPFKTQDEAQAMARAILNHQSANAILLDGEVHGNPDLKPGSMIEIKGLGQRFNGSYYVTSTHHRISHDQTYVTQFSVTGDRPNSLLDLVSTGHNGQGVGNRGAATAVAIGKVTNNKDDAGQARVKVKFPWLGDQESDWARLVAPGSGDQRGIFWLPEVGDEVLVAFQQGDVHHPFVIGGLWSGQAAPSKDGDKETVGGDGKVNQRVIQSRTGHLISLDDSDGQEQIRILDKSGKNTMTFDTSSNKITIHAELDMELKAERDITVSAGRNFSLTSVQTCSLESQMKDLSLKGATEASLSSPLKATVDSDAQTSVHGGTVSMKADVLCSLSGTPITLN